MKTQSPAPELPTRCVSGLEFQVHCHGSLPGRVLISETRDKKPECPSGIPGFWPGQNQGHLQLLGTDKKKSATFWVVRVLHPLTRSCLLSSCCWSVRLLSCTFLSCMLTGWVNAFSKSNLSDSPQQESTLLSFFYSTGIHGDAVLEESALPSGSHSAARKFSGELTLLLTLIHYS